MTDCDLVFSKYYDLYREILLSIYPAKNSTGFSERNLSVNFSKAYEIIAASNGQKALSWFEFQFGEKNNRHVDAVIINRSKSEMMIVESKRFSNPNSKLREIGKDIERIYGFVDELKECNSKKVNARVDISSINHIYGVVLADVWTETTYKKEILESFKQGSFLTKYKEDLNLSREIKDVNYKNYSLDGIASKFGKVCNYHLVSFMWEL